MRFLKKHFPFHAKIIWVTITRATTSYTRYPMISEKIVLHIQLLRKINNI